MLPQLGMRPTPAHRSNRMLDEQVVVQVLLETPTGIANAEAIAAVDGVDMIAFGANDFTAELGIPGRYDDPRITEAVAALAKACRACEKLLMVGGIGDDTVYRALVPLGVCPLVLTGTDAALLYSGAESAVARVRRGHEKAAGEQEERA